MIHYSHMLIIHQLWSWNTQHHSQLGKLSALNFILQSVSRLQLFYQMNKPFIFHYWEWVAIQCYHFSDMPMDSLYTYWIRGTAGGDFNFAVWQIWLRSPNLMYANTTYNHMYYEQYTLNIALFAKLECLSMCIASQFTKLIVGQIYCIYDISFYIPVINLIFTLHQRKLMMRWFL